MTDQVNPLTPIPAPQAECKPWQSKTLWISLFMAIAAFFPVVNKWISENPTIFTMVVLGVFSVLRVVSKDKIVIK